MDENVTFHDATDEIEAALRDPVMAARVAAVRAEMAREDHDRHVLGE